MKINMGCGTKKREGFFNVDVSPECKPDAVIDIEQLPWPWPDNSVEHVVFQHSLEHVGQNPRVFLGIIKELYRICRTNARIEIEVPHPRNDDFLNDPTHVRAITPDLLSLFNRDVIKQIRQAGGSNTPFAIYLDVDFYIESSQTILAQPYASEYERGLITDADIDRLIRERNNVAAEFRIIWVVRKPPLKI